MGVEPSCITVSHTATSHISAGYINARGSGCDTHPGCWLVQWAAPYKWEAYIQVSPIPFLHFLATERRRSKCTVQCGPTLNQGPVRLAVPQRAGLQVTYTGTMPQTSPR